MNAKNTAYLLELLAALQQREQQFQEEKQEIRADYLVRGICEKEVDGLIEDPSLFPATWLPSHLRQENLRHANPEQLRICLQEAAILLYGEVADDIDYSSAESLITKG